jgi:hypothetical protein
MRQRNIVVRQRQQIVEENTVVRRPGEMLGEQRRLIDIDDAFQPFQVVAIERGCTADRQADTVDRQRMISANPVQEVMRRTARAHVVLGVNLEEIDAAGAGQDVVAMLGFKPDSGEQWCIPRRK